MGKIEFMFGDDGRDFRPPHLNGHSGHFFSVVGLAPALCSPPISPLAPALCHFPLAEPWFQLKLTVLGIPSVTPVCSLVTGYPVMTAGPRAPARRLSAAERRL